MRITDAPCFAPALIDALHDAIEVNDAIEPDAPPPATAGPDHSADEILQCYRLCRQYWRQRRDRAGLRMLAWRLARDGDLSPNDRRRFKDARAAYKQLRFARANAAAGHRYPRLFHWVTALMGHLQDDFKHGRGAATVARALLLRLSLAAIPDALTRREIDRLRPAGAEDRRTYVRDQIAIVRNALSHGTVTGREFHEIRKIVSRMAAFHAAAGTLYPSRGHDGLFRYLALVNGLMGRMHDTLVERRVRGEQDYRVDGFAFPAAISERLATLVELFAATGVTGARDAEVTLS